MWDAWRGAGGRRCPHSSPAHPSLIPRCPTAPHRATCCCCCCCCCCRRCRCCRRDILDISSPLSDAAAAIVDDSFLRCFKSSEDDPWNWNAYLFPLWAMGVVVRTLILVPLRSVGGSADPLAGWKDWQDGWFD